MAKKARTAAQKANDARMRKALQKPATKRRAKKSAGLRIANSLGLYPLAPVKAARAFGRLNVISSVILGKDLENGFSGGASGQAAFDEARAGTGRIDMVKRWTYLRDRTDLTTGQKVAGYVEGFKANLRGSFTVAGVKRAALPAVATEALYQGAKAAKANSFIPAPLRKLVKVY